MKKTLFVASLLLCSLPAMAESGMTLSGEGIANNCTWNLFATFDSLAFTDTDTFTTLATVNLNNDKWEAMYAVGYTYSSTDKTLTLGMASYANPDSWMAVSSDGGITLSKENPVSFALSLNGSNEGGDNTLTLHAASGSTMDNIAISDTIKTLKTDTYSNIHLSSVSLGTTSTATQLYNKPNGVVLTPATGNNVNIVSARLEHAAYSNTAFKEFILEEQTWGADETVRYTTADGNQAEADHKFSFGTEGGEVTFNPSKFTDNKLVLDKTTINLTARTTFIVEDDKTVEISGATTFTGAEGKTHEKGSVFGSGELVKSGGGTLAIRLNDTNRDIDNNISNDFGGSVTVEEGTLHLFHDDLVEVSSHTARVGGGDNSVITVKEGATLELGEQTEISIPLGAHRGDQQGTHNVVITGGSVYINSNDFCGIPEIHTETSTLQDVVMTREGLDYVDSEVRAQLIVSGISIYDTREGDKVEFKHADIITDDFYYNGHTVFSNTHLYADNTLIASSLGAADNEYFTLEVVDKSHVVYGARGDDGYAEHGMWGNVDNVYVDKTSKLQTASGSALEHDFGGALMIQGECTLDIADIELPGDDAGLAVRSDGTVQAVYQGKTLTLHDIRYVTDQLSGDMLHTFNEVPCTLDLNLKDPVSALLPDGATLTNTVFTLTLTNFDSSLLIKEGDTEGYLREDVAHLTIDAFEGTPWHLVYGRYDKKTKASIFTFSTMENLQINTPEPATATLSLLALAALAARRKRK